LLLLLLGLLLLLLLLLLLCICSTGHTRTTLRAEDQQPARCLCASSLLQS
jgi:hypothetical protein